MVEPTERERLDLSRSSIGPDWPGMPNPRHATVADVIALIAPHRDTLKHINLSHNMIDTAGACRLLEYVYSMPRLQVLDLSHNWIRMEDYDTPLIEHLTHLCERARMERVILTGNEVLTPAWLTSLLPLNILHRVDPDFLASVALIRGALAESEGEGRRQLMQELGLSPAL